MVVNKGNLIVFEGVDGVGKSTLANRLVDHLTQMKLTSEYRSFPGAAVGTLGHLVYELHHEPQKYGISQLNPLSLQIMHIAAHIDSISNQIKPSLERGTTIVLDRYWWSTLVYGKAAGIKEKQLRKILKTEMDEWRPIVPSAIFLVTRAASFRLESEAIVREKWERINQAYKEFALNEQHDAPVYIIDNSSTIEGALNEVISVLQGIVADALPLPSNNADQQPQLKSVQLPLILDSSVKPQSASLVVHSKIAPAKPTEVFDTYWKFAAERQEIFYRRIQGDRPPWTGDPILASYRFTNAYRASDRVSQYLIRNVIYSCDTSVQNTFFRILLFKIFNKIETWELLLKQLEEISYSDYSFDHYDSILTNALEQGQTIFSAAYIMPSGNTSYGYARKHRNYLRLLETLMRDRVPEQISEMRLMRNAFECLRSYPMMGDFLAYQFVIDINYSNITNFSEMEFVIPGPGAKDGIRKCFSELGGLNEADIIRVVTERQSEEFSRLGINFRTLWGRNLQLIDCQNLFCEVDKYSRVAHPDIQGISGRTRIKQKYQNFRIPNSPWYPPKWGINHLIENMGDDA